MYLLRVFDRGTTFSLKFISILKNGKAKAIDPNARKAFEKVKK